MAVRLGLSLVSEVRDSSEGVWEQISEEAERLASQLEEETRRRVVAIESHAEAYASWRFHPMQLSVIQLYQYRPFFSPFRDVRPYAEAMDSEALRASLMQKTEELRGGLDQNLAQMQTQLGPHTQQLRQSVDQHLQDFQKSVAPLAHSLQTQLSHRRQEQQKSLSPYAEELKGRLDPLAQDLKSQLVSLWESFAKDRQ
ncbi:apolipoprotein A-IV-like [Engraulis encrasicolus]|uniref:apolipoprotein A-IV-like n=1 Tax=Engraulis encrasicolus TaxID=184585 RepID=UPI002FCF8E05